MEGGRGAVTVHRACVRACVAPAESGVLPNAAMPNAFLAQAFDIGEPWDALEPCVKQAGCCGRCEGNQTRTTLTEIHLCHACSDHEIEDGNGMLRQVRGEPDQVGSQPHQVQRQEVAGVQGVPPPSHT
eukprot:COSAG01_NODE_2744_length_7150_cov_5.435116_5_plen_128_part_00